jgi:hypothetical protein
MRVATALRVVSVVVAAKALLIGVTGGAPKYLAALCTSERGVGPP